MLRIKDTGEDVAMDLENSDAQVSAFFQTFAQASADLDVGLMAGCFSDVFLSATPDGVQSVPRTAFLAALPKRAQLFAAAGVEPMLLEELSQRTLDEHYVMVTTRWSAPRPAAGDTVYLSSTFLLRRDSSSMKIVLYLNHQDLSRLLGPSSSAGTSNQQQV
jgi:hypothetical protein